jgi:hypothetical protein
VLTPVNLDNQLVLRAIEIGYVFTDAVLTIELAAHEPFVPEFLPQSHLCLSLALAEVLSFASSRGSVEYLHI